MPHVPMSDVTEKQLRSSRTQSGKSALAVRPSTASRGTAAPPAAKSGTTLVERFDRRGTAPFELFRSEFGQNSWNP